MDQSTYDAYFLAYKENSDYLSVYFDSTEVIESETSDSDLLDDSEDSYISESSDYDTDLLYQIQVTNNLLGISIGLQIIILTFFMMVFFIKVIKNNVTNFI